jgi:ATP-dependent Clp protease ATP-binding subunit ClpX
MGIGADVKENKKQGYSKLLESMEPEDLLKFGLIPEFVGRVPVNAALHDLDEKSLITILTEPKNALSKQYQKLFEYENVKLKFTEKALHAVAKKAIKLKTGARGLRSVLEQAMLDIMYEIPSQTNVRECLIKEETITKNQRPILIYEDDETQNMDEASDSEEEKEAESA